MAIKPLPTLKTDVNSAIADNTAKDIQASEVRSSVIDSIDSLDYQDQQKTLEVLDLLDTTAWPTKYDSSGISFPDPENVTEYDLSIVVPIFAANNVGVPAVLAISASLADIGNPNKKPAVVAVVSETGDITWSGEGGQRAIPIRIIVNIFPGVEDPANPGTLAAQIGNPPSAASMLEAYKVIVEPSDRSYGDSFVLNDANGEPHVVCQLHAEGMRWIGDGQDRVAAELPTQSLRAVSIDISEFTDVDNLTTPVAIVSAAGSLRSDLSAANLTGAGDTLFTPIYLQNMRQKYKHCVNRFLGQILDNAHGFDVDIEYTPIGAEKLLCVVEHKGTTLVDHDWTDTDFTGLSAGDKTAIEAAITAGPGNGELSITKRTIDSVLKGRNPYGNGGDRTILTNTAGVNYLAEVCGCPHVIVQETQGANPVTVDLIDMMESAVLVIRNAWIVEIAPSPGTASHLNTIAYRVPKYAIRWFYAPLQHTSVATGAKPGDKSFLFLRHTSPYTSALNKNGMSDSSTFVVASGTPSPDPALNRWCTIDTTYGTEDFDGIVNTPCDGVSFNAAGSPYDDDPNYQRYLWKHTARNKLGQTAINTCVVEGDVRLNILTAGSVAKGWFPSMPGEPKSWISFGGIATIRAKSYGANDFPVAGFEIVAGGTGYSVGQHVTFPTGGSGTGAEFTVLTVSGGAMTSVQLRDGITISGYLNNETVTASSGGAQVKFVYHPWDYQNDSANIYVRRVNGAGEYLIYKVETADIQADEATLATWEVMPQIMGIDEKLEVHLDSIMRHVTNPYPVLDRTSAPGVPATLEATHSLWIAETS